MQYYIKRSTVLQPKNRAESHIQEFIKQFFNMRVNSEDDLNHLVANIEREVKKINSLYLRCSPMEMRQNRLDDDSDCLWIFIWNAGNVVTSMTAHKIYSVYNPEIKKIMSEEVLKFEKLKKGKGCSSPPRECVVEWHVEYADGRVRVSSGVLEGAGFDYYGCVPGVFPVAHFDIRADLASSLYIPFGRNSSLKLASPGIALLNLDCPPGGFSSFIPGVRKVLSVSSGMEVPYSVSQRVTAEKIYESSEFPYSVRWKFREV